MLIMLGKPFRPQCSASPQYLVHLAGTLKKVVLLEQIQRGNRRRARAPTFMERDARIRDRIGAEIQLGIQVK